MLYNPFEPVTLSLFDELVESGYDYFVLQRFNWPGVKEKTGFLLTPYDDRKNAEEHVFYLNSNEGKSLQFPEDVEKIDSLLSVGSGYRIFLNRIKDENWETRMKKFYEKNIINYLRTKTQFKRTDHIDIYFSLEYGRVMAEITNGETKKRTLAIELLS